jgi:hypothetical protein
MISVFLFNHFSIIIPNSYNWGKPFELKDVDGAEGGI